MSTWRSIKKVFIDTFTNQTTAFGEVNTQTATPQATWNFQYNINDDIVKSTVSGSGTVTQLGSQAVLSTTANASSSAKIETRDALRYTPGIGGVAKFTAIFTDGVVGSTQIIGIGDDNDGLFFGFDGVDFGVLHRNNGVDEWTNQTVWNTRKFPEFDHTKGNVFMIKFQWLGYGEIKFFIEDKNTGGFELCHRVMYANQHIIPSLTNPTLPLMMQVINNANNTDIVMKTPSGYIGIEGQVPEGINEVERGVSNTVIGLSTEVPILSIQNPLMYQSKTNRQSAHIVFNSISSDGTKGAIVTLIRGATLTGATFVDVDTNAVPLKSDSLATAVSGGKRLVTLSMGKVDSIILELLTKLRPGETLTIAGSSAGTTDIATSLVSHTLF